MKKITPLALSIAMFTFAISNVYSQSNINEKVPMIQTDISKVTKADEANSFNEYNAVVEALQPYIKSATSGDGKVIRTAFYDHAHIVGSIGGQFYNMDLDVFAGAVAEGGPSENVQHHIAWIDISGPAAAAKVEFIDWGGNRFTDFFVLYKHEGQWKISGKVYDSHSNN